MKAEYKHTQFGVWMFAVFFVTGIVIAFVSLSIFAEGRFATAIIMVCLYLLGLALFYSFTIEISGGKLKFWFCIGGVGKSCALEEIQSAQ